MKEKFNIVVEKLGGYSDKFGVTFGTWRRAHRVVSIILVAVLMVLAVSGVVLAVTRISNVWTSPPVEVALQNLVVEPSIFETSVGVNSSTELTLKVTNLNTVTYVGVRLVLEVECSEALSTGNVTLTGPAGAHSVTPSVGKLKWQTNVVDVAVGSTDYTYHITYMMEGTFTIKAWFVG